MHPVRYSSGEAEKERRPQQKYVTFIQARRGDSRPNDQAERGKGPGRLHTYREVCGSDKGNVNQVGYFEYSFVEMTLVVEGGDKSSGRVEGVVGFRTGGDKSQIDATGLEHQDGTKVKLCFLCS